MSINLNLSDVESIKHDLEKKKYVVDADNIAHHLKYVYPKYKRIKFNTLKMNVDKLLNKTGQSNNSPNSILKNMYIDHSSSDQHSENKIHSLGIPSKRSLFDSNETKISSEIEYFEPFSQCSIPDFDLNCLAGIEKTLQSIRELVIRPLRHPEVFRHLGVSPISGILLHGPPGSGKTKLALAVAGEAKVPFFKISGPEIISGVSGKSEAAIRSLFETAKDNAPCLIFIDEIDSICPKRETTGREMERRIVAQLGTCMDDTNGSFIITLAATNRPDALDSMLRRNGRFDKEISMGIPDDKARTKILEVITKNMNLASNVSFEALGKLTPGFVGADLEAMSKEAALITVNRIFQSLNNQPEPYTEEQLEKLRVEHQDFLEAIQFVQPSAKREGFATTPDISWENVGGLFHQRKELEDQICLPIKEHDIYEKMGLTVPAGILLYGPPGCGKTLLAKAVAKESGANFIAVKGPELLNKYLGESERAIRQVFQRAKISAPCIVFFDELDSLCPKRSHEGNQATERVVNQLLTEMDGITERKSVYVVAATNRPELIDPAMLRPGRLDRLVYVPLPDRDKRIDILKRLACRTQLSNIDFDYIAENTEKFSGADLSALLRQAILFRIEEYRLNRTQNRDNIIMDTSMNQDNQCLSPIIESNDDNIVVQMSHFIKALETVRPSVSEECIDYYTNLYTQMMKGNVSI